MQIVHLLVAVSKKKGGFQGLLQHLLLTITLRITTLPPPQILGHIVQRPRRFETQLFLGQTRISGQIRNITRPPTHDGMRELVSTHLPHSIDHVQHRHAYAFTQIESSVFTLCLQLVLGKDVVPVESLDRIDVTCSEVFDVDVVSNAGSIRSGVVVSEHLQSTLAVLSDGHLSEKREKVSRFATRILADLARFVSTGGIEVSKSDGAEFGISIADVADDDLAHPLGSAVHRLRCEAGGFRNGNLGRGTIDGGGRRVDESVASIVMHNFEEVDQTTDVDVVVVDRDLGALTDSLESGAEDDRPDLFLAGVGFKGFADILLGSEITFEDVDFAIVFVLLGSVGGELVKGDFLETLDGGREGVVVVVEDCRETIPFRFIECGCQQDWPTLTTRHDRYGCRTYQ